MKAQLNLTVSSTVHERNIGNICHLFIFSLNDKRICFDLYKGRFIDPKIGRNSIYDMEVSLKQHEISLGRRRRKRILFFSTFNSMICVHHY